MKDNLVLNDGLQVVPVTVGIGILEVPLDEDFWPIAHVLNGLELGLSNVILSWH